MRVWVSTDGRWRLECQPSRPRPWRLELNGGLIAQRRSQAEILARLAEWLTETGEDVPEFVER